MIGSNAGPATFPGLTLKAWVQCDQTGAIIKSFNVSGVAKSSAGSYTVTFANAMATSTYFGKTTPLGNNSYASMPQSGGAAQLSAAQGKALTFNGAGAATDMPFYAEFWE